MTQLLNANIQKIYLDFPSNALGDDDILVFYNPSTGTTRGIQAKDALATANVQDFAWDGLTPYAIDAPVLYQGQWWISLENDNEGNIPTEGAFWTAENKITAITIEPWEAGIFDKSYAVVSVTNIIYRLKGSAVIPFNSSVSPDSDTDNWEQIGRFDVGESFSTGFIKGGDMSVNALDDDLLDISEGSGIIYNNTDPDNPTTLEVQWTAKVGLALNTTTPIVTWFYVDDNSDTIKQTTTAPTSETRRTRLYFGRTIWQGTFLTTANDRDILDHQGQQLRDLADALGFMKISGLRVSANGANLKLTRSSGVFFDFGSNGYQNPHKIPFLEEAPVSFQYVNQLGTLGTAVTDLDVTNYDNGGVLTAMPNNDFAISEAYFFQSGQVGILRSQQTYNSLAEAVQDIPYCNPVKPSILSNGLRIAYIINQKGIANLTTAISGGLAAIYNTNKFGEIGGGAASAGSGFLEALNNLSELTDTVAARENIGLSEGYTLLSDANQTITPTNGRNNYEWPVGGNRTLTWSFTGVPDGAEGIIRIVKDNSATARYIAVPTNSQLQEGGYTEENELGFVAVNVSNVANNGSGICRVTTGSAHGLTTGQRTLIASILGTLEVNGKHTVTVIDGTNFDIPVNFNNAYTSGGTVTRLAKYLAIEQAANSVSWLTFKNRSGVMDLQLIAYTDAF